MGEFFSGKKKIWDGMDMVPDRRRQTRRQHPRFHVNFEAELQCANVSYQCTMVDISQMGCRVITEKPIQNASRDVIVKFIAPKQLDHIYVKGKIRLKNQTEQGFSLGISFEKKILNLEDLMG